ncbi:hypothetical protein C9374_011173 [Naegleria lovaniensis]|uniref:Uncharacterized protein n=1 Tax=Naegleria lovaniensis TaxID=51637 RepID=A0AA88GEU1_NAELO|nr:uncharacterized protein C9374_011173 [Naegleria lovaniensis]KAG2374094.1 hypothetical protein C9374_011173 [Naegleria lovaniensis]
MLSQSTRRNLLFGFFSRPAGSKVLPQAKYASSSWLLNKSNQRTSNFQSSQQAFGFHSSLFVFKKEASSSSTTPTEIPTSEEPVVFGEFELGEAKKEVIEAVFRLFSKHGDVSSAQLYLRTWYNEIIPREKKLKLKKSKYDSSIDCLLYGYYGQSCKPSGEEQILSHELLTKSSKLFSELFLKDINDADLRENALENCPKGENSLLKKVRSRIEKLVLSEEGEKVLAEKFAISDRNDLIQRLERCDFITSVCLAMMYYHDEKMRDFSKSESFLLRALTYKPDDERCLLMFASLNEFTGNIKNAEQAYLLLSHYNPNDPDVLGDIAVFYRNMMHDRMKAKKYFNMALKLNPNHVNNLRNYAMYLFEEESNVEEALQLLEQAMGIVSTDYMTMSSYGMVLMVDAMNKPSSQANAIFKKARDVLKRSVQLNPFQSCTIIMNYAISERMCGNKIDARKAFDVAVKAFEEHESKTPNDSHVELFNNYGSFLFEEEHYQDAKDKFQKALSLNPNASEVHTNLALTYTKLNNLEQAEKHYRKATKDYDDTEINVVKHSLFNYAKFSWDHTKDLDKAKNLFTQLITICNQEGGEKNEDNSQYYEEYKQFLNATTGKKNK